MKFSHSNIIHKSILNFIPRIERDNNLEIVKCAILNGTLGIKLKVKISHFYARRNKCPYCYFNSRVGKCRCSSLWNNEQMKLMKILDLDNDSIFHCCVFLKISLFETTKMFQHDSIKYNINLAFEKVKWK